MIENDGITLKLKEKYENSNYLTRFITNETYSLSDSYINLVVVKQEEAEDKEKSLKGSESKDKEFRDERLASYESLHEVSSPIEIKDIFNTQDGKEIKKVLVYGRAGIGKSTLCKYLAVKWQDGSLWHDKFKAVIWLPLRELLDTEGKNTVKLENVIIDKCIGLIKPTEEEVNKYLTQNYRELLFILDGYDEIAQVIDDAKYMDLRLLLQNLLEDKGVSVVLTSRPMTIKLGLETMRFDKQLENVGFSNKNIKQYVEKFYPNKRQELLKFLERNKSIWGIAHIPINLDLVCSVWESSANIEQTEYTMSKLYLQINRKLLERYLEKSQRVNLEGLTEQDYEDKTKAVVEGLEKLAIYGMLSNQIIIPAAEVKKVNPEILKSGLVRTVGEVKYSKDRNIYFLHLTFQEFYAASHIAKSLEDVGSENHKKAIELIAKHKYNPYYQVMWWFVAGILYERGKEKGSYLGLMRFWHEIESHPKDLIGFQHMCLVIKCLDECMADTTLNVRKNLMDKVTEHIKYSVYEKSYNQYIKLYKRLAISPFVANKVLVDQELISALVNAILRNKNLLIGWKAADVLSKIIVNNKNVILTLINVFNNDSGVDVRKNAANALGKIAVGDRNAITALINVFNNDSDVDVRRNAADALGKIAMGDRNAITALINALLNDKDVRRSAADAFGKIAVGDRNAISVLINVFNNDSDVDVRRNAANALGKIAVGDRNAITALINALLNDKDVRRSAASALGIIAVGDRNAITALINAFNDKDDYVRRNAASALGKIAVGDRNAITALINVFNNDSDVDVRRNAASALGIIAVGNSNAITALINALNDKGVRRNVASALGMIAAGDSNATIAIINILNDSDYHVRCEAAEALSKIDVGNSKAITVLISALNVNDDFLLSKAAKVLSRISMSSSEAKVIIALINALDDHYEWGKCNVVEALGDVAIGDSDAVTALINALNGNDERLRRKAASALNKICVSNENIKQIASLNNKISINAVIAHHASIKFIKCWLVSNNIDWLERLIMSDTCITLNQEKPFLTLRDGSTIEKINLSKEQVVVLLNVLEKQAKEHDLPTNVYEYYKGIGKLGFSNTIGMKELTPLHIAARDGDLEKIKSILEKDKTDINNQNNEQQDTPLIIAVKSKRSHIVNYLIEQKADVACVNLAGEDAAEQGLRSFLNNGPLISLLFKHSYTDDLRIRSLLENAVFQYTGENDDQTLRKIVNLIAGKGNVDDVLNNNDNLLTTYRMYLENLSTFQIEHQRAVSANGQNVVSILTARLYFYIELYLKIQKGMIADLPLAQGNKNMSVKDAINQLQTEILTISDTLINAKLNISCRTYYPLNNIDLMKALSYARAEGIIEKLKSSQIGYECSIHTGYLTDEGEGHCIYVGLNKLSVNQVIARVDNRWLTETYRGLYKKNGYLREGEPEIVKSYYVGAFKLPQHYGELREYVGGVIFAFCNKFGDNANIINQAYNLIYGRRLLNAQPLPLSITQTDDEINLQINSWPFHNIQRNTGNNSPDNCTLSSHNLGVSVRCGNHFFKWLKRYELQSVPSLNNPINTNSLQTSISLSGGQTESTFSHTELMKKFQQELGVSWNDVFNGTAVEQALVDMAGLSTEDQSGAMFRQKSPRETAFSLKFISLSDYNKFINYYNKKFPDLIKRKGFYNAEGLSQIVMDTNVLYGKVAPALGNYKVIEFSDNQSEVIAKQEGNCLVM